MKQTNAEEEDADDLAYESTGDATTANAEGKEGGDDRSEEDGSEKNSGARREEERMVALAATMMVTLANICNGYGMHHTAGVEHDGGLDVEYSTGSHQHGELRRRGGQESDKTGGSVARGPHVRDLPHQRSLGAGREVVSVRYRLF
ncbi:hypothetical protein PF006_g9727 [Phytophthora fragariae]|uniref:Uncharacterized protein n=1 Tax=Phytophthora fragariae TaxID=53985 RepID=A0A6A3U414_9STRA|nr:hypothetical protein PF006_g9727 [Phytophthora fragariae]